MVNDMKLDPRIGKLNSGMFYAFANGYNEPEVVGSLDAVEIALGIRSAPGAVPQPRQIVMSGQFKSWCVTMKFQHPAWDEVDGIKYTGIIATSKSGANKIARKRAENDGHTGAGKGLYTFTAVEE